MKSRDASASKKGGVIHKKSLKFESHFEGRKIPRGVPQAQGSVARRLRCCGPGSTREDFSLLISFESKQKIYLFLHSFHNRIHISIGSSLVLTVPKLIDRINSHGNFADSKLLLLIMTLTANRIVDMVTEQLDGKPTADR